MLSSIYFTCILIALSATGYGYMISALAPTVEAANALAPPLMVPLLASLTKMEPRFLLKAVLLFF